MQLFRTQQQMITQISKTPHVTECCAQAILTETKNIYDIATTQFSLLQQPVYWQSKCSNSYTIDLVILGIHFLFPQTYKDTTACARLASAQQSSCIALRQPFSQFTLRPAVWCACPATYHCLEASGCLGLRQR